MALGRSRLRVLRAKATLTPVRRRTPPSGRRLLVRRALLAAGVFAACGVLLGVVFAGSSTRLAAGVRVAGVDVGGLTPHEARTLLERRSRELEHAPVLFTAAGKGWRVPPRRLGVEVDWAAAVATARHHGDGFGPVRGLWRIGVRVFGTDIAPPTRVYDAALDYQVDAIAKAVRRAQREAAVELRGLRVVVVPGKRGLRLNRVEAEKLIVRSLAAFSRKLVVLPVSAAAPSVSAAELASAASQTRTALSAPVRLVLGPTRWRVPRWRIAGLLALPRNGSRTLEIGGPGADRYFARLARRIDRPARNADFAITSTGVRVIPARAGLVVDVPATAKALLTAALSPERRVARVVHVAKPAERTTEEARAMGITGLVGSYETIYGGEPNRISNVQLVARLIDRTLIPPGATFSFNETTGERTVEKGFKEAPVIINGELQTGLGGGVCQVSTTVFNAAYEAGLKIVARTNHALYIDHYPLARDATVNYPDLDLRFVNDTPRWLLLRTWVGASSLTVALYGAPQHRVVKSETAALKTVGAVPEKRTADATMLEGTTVTEEYGAPPRTTSVRRLVYTVSGKLLHNDFWTSYYRGEPTVIRYGTKPKPKPPPPPPPPTTTGPNGDTGTSTTPTTPTTTTPAETGPSAPGAMPPTIP